MTTAEIPQTPEFTGSLMACVGPLRPESIHEGVGLALELLRGARMFARSGIVTPKNLTLHLAVLRQHEIGEALWREYVDPLGRGTAAASLDETIRDYIHHDTYIHKTSQHLLVPPHTVPHPL